MYLLFFPVHLNFFTNRIKVGPVLAGSSFLVPVRHCASKIFFIARAERPGFDCPQVQPIFLYSTTSRSVLGPTQPSIQWVPGGSFPEDIIVFNTTEIMFGRLSPLQYANEHKTRPAVGGRYLSRRPLQQPLHLQ
jgi:hypothetical protein